MRRDEEPRKARDERCLEPSSAIFVAEKWFDTPSGGYYIRRSLSFMPRAPRPAPRPSRGGQTLGLLVALSAGAAGALVVAWSPGCARTDPPGSTATRTTQVTAPAASSVHVQASPSASAAVLPEKVARMLAALEDGGADAAAADAHGPLLGITSMAAQIYAQPTGAREARIGYVRRGAKVAVDPHIVKGKVCEEGWYKLIPYGYICAKHATLNLDDPEVRLGLHEPAVDDVLPYKYAFNVAHGTPLYRNVPSRDEMAEYEPYLAAAKRERKERTASVEGKKRKKKHRAASTSEATEEPDPPAETQRTVDADAGASDASAAPSVALDASTASADPSDAGAVDAEVDAADTRPWWQRKYEPGKGPEVKLSDLTEDSDKILAKRMVKGFYVAVDRTFLMNDRAWHKTTAGLLAPADRFAIVKPNPFHGEEIAEADAASSVGFVTVKSATTYELGAKGEAKATGALHRYDRVFLTGKQTHAAGGDFREAQGGAWLRERDITWTEPGKPPADLKPGEKWIDVNLTRQTLVAFEGTRAVFATLVSTGRKGKDKEHDHQTPTGTWRVREKHVAATMDGDGAAAGDMPYSIEDVPYIQYFHESYALHGAFWHDNFGRPQSHGCVNLAPLDAKRLFFWSEAPVPHGWHGVFSSPEQPGTLVTVHE